VEGILRGLETLVEREWKPTYLQLNVGTLIPYLLSGVEPDVRFEFGGRVVYSSVIFEKSRLRRVTLRAGTFVQTTFSHAEWHDVVFEDCVLGEPVFDRAAVYDAVVLAGCQIDGVRLLESDDEETREYAPERIRGLLSQIGVSVVGGPRDVSQDQADEQLVDGDTRKMVRRVLNLFRRTTFVSEGFLIHRFPRDARRVQEEILPLMVEFGIVEPKLWRGSGKQEAWGLTVGLEEVEKADADPGHRLYAFWRRVDKLHAG
jgi:hypothetical protein